MIIKDDFEILKQYEPHFKTAQVGYIRGLYSQDVKTIKEICSHYNIKLSNPNCASCILGAIKQLAVLYFEYRQTITPTNIKTKKTKKQK